MLALNSGHTVRDIGAPNLIRSRDGHPAQQVWIDLVPRMRFAGVRARCHTGQAHTAHQPLDLWDVVLGSG